MEAPPVRYVTTSDGLRIAYCIAGEGFPFVLMPFHHNHMQRQWGVPMFYGSALAQSFQVVHYDSRTQGLSTRGLAKTPAPEDFDRDLEAVVDHLGLDRFVLAGYGGFGHVAVRYAAAHPERVHALVLLCASISFAAWPLSALWKLAEENWDLFLQMDMSRNLQPDTVARALDFLRETDTQADYLDRIRAFSTSNIEDVLPLLCVPTLLLHSMNQNWLSPDEAAKLASAIEGSRLVFAQGEPETHFMQCMEAIESFLASVLPSGEQASNVAASAAFRHALSPRQSEVLRLIAQGKTNTEIARALVLSERTVQRHIADIYAKIDVRNRAEATAYALHAPPHA